MQPPIGLERPAVGTWVARLRSVGDEHPDIGLVRDVYDGKLSIELFHANGLSLGKTTRTVLSPDGWRPIDEPDFQSLSASFSYGALIRYRPVAAVQGCPLLSTISPICSRDPS